jgi:transposase
MERVYTIALDTHCSFTEFVVLTPGGRIRDRGRCAMTIPALVDRVLQVPRPRAVVFEEGPLADWIGRGLAGKVDDLAICDPRRNHLIAKDSDKDDAIDAEKLARLYRGGYIKRVHHAESFERVVFKRRVGLYHDSVRQRVRLANRVMGELRGYGVFVSERCFAEKDERTAFWKLVPAHAVIRADMRCLMHAYDAAVQRAATMRRSLIRLAGKEPQIRRFTALPGVKWIRAATFYAYVDTPWRFKSKQALWKYLGIGLERRHSGAGPEQVHVPWQVNRTLKSSILGAAKSAIASGKNPFANQYERWIHDGLTSRNARRNVARSQAAVMWGMWKNGGAYRPELVGVEAKGQALVLSRTGG